MLVAAEGDVRFMWGVHADHGELKPAAIKAL
jgi:hypothetical protein